MSEAGGGAVLVEVVRSGLVESVHRGHVVLLDGDGSVLLDRGRTGVPMFPRSSNKPLQAVGMLGAGLVVDDAQLAVAAASHNGEPRHLDVVGSILADAGLAESDLACPPDLPFGERARRDALAAGAQPRRIFMNCSGKHAAMLKTCRDRGWPTSDYLDPDHPLQRVLADALAGLAGQQIPLRGTDGCGAPIFGLTLRGLAGAFLTLADAGATEAGPGRIDPAARVSAAMRRFPELVGGTDRAVTRLMAGLPGLVAKDGAEGVWAAAFPGVGAVAVKIDDGAMRAADRVVVGALRRLGVAEHVADASVLDDLAEEPVLGGGRPIGTVRLRPDAF